MVPESKLAIQIGTTALTNNGTECGSGVTNYVDTKGFDYAVFDVILSPPDDPTNYPDTMNLMEADVTTSSSFATISGFVGGTDFTIATQDTSVFTSYRIRVPLAARKRYLKVAIIPQTSHAAGCVILANLFRAEAAPVSATLAGVNNLV